jgi:hypothetical protein
LNVFLAIAVDNLANAHELTKDEEEEQAAEEEVERTCSSFFLCFFFNIYFDIHRIVSIVFNYL